MEGLCGQVQRRKRGQRLTGGCEIDWWAAFVNSFRAGFSQPLPPIGRATSPCERPTQGNGKVYASRRRRSGTPHGSKGSEKTARKRMDKGSKGPNDGESAKQLRRGLKLPDNYPPAESLRLQREHGRHADARRGPWTAEGRLKIACVYASRQRRSGTPNGGKGCEKPGREELTKVRRGQITEGPKKR
eukprot:SM000053S17500  [mRNA]  locus=s53:632829:633647:- [translate_table: standard]